jgi:hypothetical protein
MEQPSSGLFMFISQLIFPTKLNRIIDEELSELEETLS